ncbi:MAG: hypothetical protein OQL19_00050 [Gammaproteobacteria bacterium]|nr:hypothetical protein [Gammaproteobacteria bacterium]
MDNRIKNFLSSTIVLLLVSMMVACSSLSGEVDGSDIKSTASGNNSSGYYRGHYGQSGWNDSVSDKLYSKSYPVFIKNETK